MGVLGVVAVFVAVVVRPVWSVIVVETTVVVVEGVTVVVVTVTHVTGKWSAVGVVVVVVDLVVV